MELLLLLELEEKFFGEGRRIRSSILEVSVPKGEDEDLLNRSVGWRYGINNRSSILLRKY